MLANAPEIYRQIAEGTRSVEPLPTLQRLFRACDASGVQYVIWKSLEELPEQLGGSSKDIDVIFLPEQRGLVFQTLWAAGFVLDEGSSGRAGDDLFVFRGFAPEKLAHLMIHGHFSCRFGSKTAKEYRYPYEREMIEASIRVCGLRCLSVPHFYVTRLLAAILKDKKQDTYITRVGIGYFALPFSMRLQLDGLLADYISCPVEQLMHAIATVGASALKQQYASAQARVVQIADARPSARSVRGMLAQRIFRIGRSKLGTGAEIVLLGHDGAGKTSTSSKLAATVRKVGTCRQIYMGRNRWSRPVRAWDSLRQHLPAQRATLVVWTWLTFLELLCRWTSGRIASGVGSLVIYDRGFLDLAIKYKHKKGWSSRRIAALGLRRGCRQGDLRYLLVADPHVAAERTRTVSAPEIARRRKDLEQIAGDYRLIDTTSLSPDAVVGLIVRDLFALVAQRQAAQRARPSS